MWGAYERAATKIHEKAARIESGAPRGKQLQMCKTRKILQAWHRTKNAHSSHRLLEMEYYQNEMYNPQIVTQTCTGKVPVWETFHSFPLEACFSDSRAKCTKTSIELPMILQGMKAFMRSQKSENELGQSLDPKRTCLQKACFAQSELNIILLNLCTIKKKTRNRQVCKINQIWLQFWFCYQRLTA